MSVFLLILKWIGIIILSVLALLLVILLYLLFAPFHYDIKLMKKDTFRIDASISSFLYCAGFRFYKDDGISKETTLRLFWGAYRKVSAEDEAPGDDTAPEISATAKDITPENSISVKDTAPERSVTVSEAEEVSRAPASITARPEISPAKTDEPAEADLPDKSAEPDAPDELDQALNELEAENKKTKKRKSGSDDKKHLISNANLNAVRIILREVFILLKRVMPDKIYADFEYSTGEPDLTGEVFGAIACIPVFLRKGNTIVPDFLSEDPYFRGYIGLSGNIYLIFLLAALIKILIHKECRDLIFSFGG